MRSRPSPQSVHTESGAEGPGTAGHAHTHKMEIKTIMYKQGILHYYLLLNTFTVSKKQYITIIIKTQFIYSFFPHSQICKLVSPQQ